MYSIKDPIQIKKYERILRRPLTDAEKYGEKEIYVFGVRMFLTLEDVTFPYGFMSEESLLSLHKKYNR